AVTVIVRVVVAVGGIRAGRAVAVTLGHAGGQCVIPACGGTGKPGGTAYRAVAAYTQLGPAGKRAVARTLARNDVDDPADRVRAIEAAGRPAQDFDALNGGRVHGHPVGAALHGAIDAHAVNQQQGVIGIGSAQHDAGGCLATAVVG